MKIIKLDNFLRFGWTLVGNFKNLEKKILALCKKLRPRRAHRVQKGWVDVGIQEPRNRIQNGVHIKRGMDYCGHSRRRGSSHDMNESSSGDVRVADLGAALSQWCKEPRNWGDIVAGATCDGGGQSIPVWEFPSDSLSTGGSELPIASLYFLLVRIP